MIDFNVKLNTGKINPILFQSHQAIDDVHEITSSIDLNLKTIRIEYSFLYIYFPYIYFLSKNL